MTNVSSAPIADKEICRACDPEPTRRGTIRGLSKAGFHDIAYVDWGPDAATPVLCVHGLTRQGRDFDHLAACLATQGRRVVCPDLPGRGSSDWLPTIQISEVKM